MLNFFAFFLIPVYTLLFPHDTGWFTTNFSVIAVMRDQRGWFLLWGVLVAGFLSALLFPIIRTLKRRLAPRLLLALALFLLVQAVVIPYLPEDFPFFSFLHVVFAFVACTLLVLCVLLILLRCWREEPERYRRYFRWLALIGVGCGVLFLLAGIITSGLEIFFVLSMTLLVRRLYLDRRPPKKF